MGDILAVFFLGIVVGFIARALHPGKDEMGIIATAILGLSGAIIAQGGVPLGLYRKGDILNYAAAVILSILILFIYGQIKCRNK